MRNKNFPLSRLLCLILCLSITSLVLAQEIPFDDLGDAQAIRRTYACDSTEHKIRLKITGRYLKVRADSVEQAKDVFEQRNVILFANKKGYVCDKCDEDDSSDDAERCPMEFVRWQDTTYQLPDPTPNADSSIWTFPTIGPRVFRIRCVECAPPLQPGSSSSFLQTTPDNPLAEGLRIFPNPTTSDIQLDYQLIKAQTNLEVHLYDLNGKLVFKQLLGERAAGEQSEVLQLGRLGSGFYLLGLMSSDGLLLSEPLQIE